MHNAASLVFLAQHNLMYYGINRWAYNREREKHHLQSNKGVGLFHGWAYFEVSSCRNQILYSRALFLWVPIIQIVIVTIETNLVSDVNNFLT